MQAGVAVLGATLLEQWELPDEVITAVRHQHTVSYVGDHITWVQLLQVASTMLAGDLEAPMQHMEDVEALAALGLEAPDLENVAELLSASHAQLETLAKAVA